MPGQIIARGKSTWLVRVFQGRDVKTGKRAYQNKTIRGTKKDAEAFLTATLRERDLGHVAAPSKITVGELLDSVLRDYKVNGKGYAWAEGVIRVRLTPFFGHLPARKVDTDLIQRYIEARQEAGDANATTNRALALLRRGFNLAAKATPPKVARVPRIPFLKEHNVRKGFFEPEEYCRMREALPPEIRPVMTFAYYTGCRRAEILSLQWGQVDLAERVVRLEPGTTKNDQARTIPLTGELHDTLVMQKAIRDQQWPKCPWVFFRAGEPLRDFRDAWEAAARAARLTDEGGKPTKLFHDLRRTGVRNLIRAGVPERVAMAISGHKTRSVFDRYNIVSESDLKDATRRLDEYLSKKTEESAKLAHYRHTDAAQRVQ